MTRAKASTVRTRRLSPIGLETLEGRDLLSVAGAVQPNHVIIQPPTAPCLDLADQDRSVRLNIVDIRPPTTPC